MSGTPPTSPHKAAGIRFPGGDGLRPAGLSEGEHSPAVEGSFPTRSDVKAFPL